MVVQSLSLLPPAWGVAGGRAVRPQTVRPVVAMRPSAPEARAPVTLAGAGGVWPGSMPSVVPSAPRAAASPRLVIVPPAAQAVGLSTPSRCAATPAGVPPRPMPVGACGRLSRASGTARLIVAPRPIVCGSALTVTVSPCVPRPSQAPCAFQAGAKRTEEDLALPLGVPRMAKTARRGRASVGNEFASQAALERALRNREVDEFLGVLPESVAIELLGGSHGLEQVTDPHVRERALRRAVELKAGPDGGSLQAAARAWRGFCAYIEIQQLPNGGLPASSILVAAYLEWESANASGSAGGSSVANSRRVGLLWLAEKLAFPLAVASPVVMATANPAQIREWRRDDPEGRQRKTAGSLPIAYYCHFEHLAKAKQPSPVREFVRSMIVFSHMMSVRAKDTLRTVPCKDATDHANVITGWSYFSKDGDAMQTYAPAEGFLGPFTWWKEHHKLVSKWGKALVMYKIRYGGHNSILHAECDDPVKSPDGKTPCVMPKEQMLASIKDVCAMPPLSLTPEQYAELGLSSHSNHGSPSDMLEFMGSSCPFSPTLFTREDAREIGHWLRLNKAEEGRGTAEAVPQRRGQQPAQSSSNVNQSSEMVGASAAAAGMVSAESCASCTTVRRKPTMWFSCSAVSDATSVVMRTPGPP